MILEVQNQSAADQAGLRATKRDAFGGINYGDVIISINGKPIESNEDLVEYIDRNKAVGDKVNLKFMRNKKEFGTTVELQELR